jgi:hypothetical protein
MQRLVTAKPGVTIPAGQPFIFTGGGASANEFWEVDVVPDSVRPHGIAVQTIDSTKNYDAFLFGLGPIEVPVSTTVAKDDEVTPDGAGKFRKRLRADNSAGQVIVGGTTSAVVFMYYNTAPTGRGSVVGTTANPTRSAGTFAAIPEMTTQIKTHGGDVQVTFNGNFNLVSGDNFDIALFRGATEIPDTRRTIGCTIPGGTIDGQVVMLTVNVPNVPAGTYTISVGWKANAGSARAFGTQRSLDCIETY